MADTPQYVKGEASITEPQLAQGDATQLNQDAAQIPEQAAPQEPQIGEAPAQPEQPLPPVQTAKPETGPVNVSGEDDSLLYGPTSRPNEHVTTGASLGAKATLPPDSHKWMPALVEAAQDPTAPAFFKEMLQVLQYHAQNG